MLENINFDEGPLYALVETEDFEQAAEGYRQINEAFVCEDTFDRNILYIELKKEDLGKLNDKTSDIADAIKRLSGVEEVYWAGSGYFEVGFRDKKDLPDLIKQIDNKAAKLL